MAADGLLVAATLGNGLTGGLLLGFSCAVLPGLARVGDDAFVSSFRAIQNPVFGLVFLGTPIVTAGAVAAHTVATDRPALPWVIAGLAGAVATLAVTFARNVPLNVALDAAATTPGEAGGMGATGATRAARLAFERPWTRWNAVRALTSAAATACLARALAG